jgi:nitroalkane oxidase
MAFDSTLTPEQKQIQLHIRHFAETVLAPIVQAVDEELDPLRGFQMMKPAYVEASKPGMAWAMLPKEYGGGGLSNVDSAEEVQAVDPGFGTTLLVNGLNRWKPMSSCC